MFLSVLSSAIKTVTTSNSNGKINEQNPNNPNINVRNAPHTPPASITDKQNQRIETANKITAVNCLLSTNVFDCLLLELFVLF